MLIGMKRPTIRTAATGLLAVLILGSILILTVGRWGNMYFYGATLAALLFAIVTLDVWRTAYGWSRALGAFVTVVILECVSIGASLYFGWPFGRFQYTGLLGWEILGLVPWTVPVVWTFILAASLALTRPMSLPTNQKDRYSQTFSWCFDAALFSTLLDAAIEPVAARVGLKIFAVQAGFQGVPYQHMLGWFIVSFLCCAAILAWTRGVMLQGGLARPFTIGTLLLLAFWFALALKFNLPLAIAFGFVMFFAVLYKQRLIGRREVIIQA
ncbi:hypothetical protein A3E39_04850 [Candidatus Uhrbacteria bacterium RIFCSPHIGHO2_12_FULL_60_25]|uniref:Carotenoid biosynthesis protein n=1 Tax=Candidatus Uhrbacteria bacterium RIFCSPHIGHO2_12_FULL_60_25 TaxID=1802399 RepID=A0A1F7UKA2_9BACT|nr:MAG: hypothetical protein A3E39_04850 [Candidatus Uhrbacteria bacterium RIFCSPHIGHO2_12_FULL_60_25]